MRFCNLNFFTRQKEKGEINNWAVNKNIGYVGYLGGFKR